MNMSTPAVSSRYPRLPFAYYSNGQLYGDRLNHQDANADRHNDKRSQHNATDYDHGG